MANLEIINKIIENGSFIDNGYKYFLDLHDNGASWIIKKAKITNGYYDTSQAVFVCSFEF